MIYFSSISEKDWCKIEANPPNKIENLIS
jgi:hypothetical protein